MNRQQAHDVLLTWCSEVGSGDLDQFRRSCAYLSLNPRDAASALSMLGHVEFDYDTRRFAAAPSTLTTIPGLPGRLLLTGARNHGLLAQLADVAADGEWDVDVARDPCHHFGAAPSSVFVDADPASAAGFAHAAGLKYAPDAATELSRLLPDVRLETATVAHRPDERFPHARVDPHTFQPRWDDAGRDRGAGLWFYRTWGRRREVVLYDGQSEPRLVLDGDLGPYLMSRPADSDPIIEYRRSHRLLIVNAAAPLPALHARSACLCSGRLPIRRDVAPGVAYDHYVNVAPQVAHQILRSLEAAE